MRITISQGPFFPVPPLRGGAVEKVWFDLGREFARRGHAVTHVSRLCDNLPEAEVIDGVSHRRVPGFDRRSWQPAAKACDLVYSLRVLAVLPPADVLVTNSFFLPALYRGGDRGLLYVHAARHPRGQMFLYGHAARIQAVSETVAGAIKSQSPQVSAIVRAIPNPVPAALMDADYSPLPPSAREPLILYCGRVHPEKGLDLLISAFACLKSTGQPLAKLVLAGPWQEEFGGGGTSYKDELVARAGAWSESIEWLGLVKDDSELKRLYRAARLFVYPSLADKGESFGLAPLEAMANGAPVLVSSLPCFGEFISAGRSGLVFDHAAADPVRALAGMLEKALAEPANLDAVAAAGFARARQYSLPLVAAMYLDDFASLTGA